jgi:hypothetical protein
VERGVEHVLAADIEKQIAKIVMSIRPGGAVVVEDAVDRIGPAGGRSCGAMVVLE